MSSDKFWGCDIEILLKWILEEENQVHIREVDLERLSHLFDLFATQNIRRGANFDFTICLGQYF